MTAPTHFPAAWFGMNGVNIDCQDGRMALRPHDPNWRLGCAPS
jgi:hypothetical protein